MTAYAVHMPALSVLLNPLCGAYHGCAGLYYALDEEDHPVPQAVTCRNCLRIMESGAA